MSESERYGSISRLDFLDTLPPACAHEWRGTGVLLLTHPPHHPEVCRICGAQRVRREQRP